MKKLLLSLGAVAAVVAPVAAVVACGADKAPVTPAKTANANAQAAGAKEVTTAIVETPKEVVVDKTATFARKDKADFTKKDSRETRLESATSPIVSALEAAKTNAIAKAQAAVAAAADGEDHSAQLAQLTQQFNAATSVDEIKNIMSSLTKPQTKTEGTDVKIARLVPMIKGLSYTEVSTLDFSLDDIKDAVINSLKSSPKLDEILTYSDDQIEAGLIQAFQNELDANNGAIYDSFGKTLLSNIDLIANPATTETLADQIHDAISMGGSLEDFKTQTIQAINDMNSIGEYSGDAAATEANINACSSLDDLLALVKADSDLASFQ